MRVGGGKSLNKWVNGCIYIVEEEQYVKKKKVSEFTVFIKQ